MAFRRTYRARNGDVRKCETFTIRYPRDGQMLEESTGTESRREAERLLKLREGDIERGLPVSPKMGRLRFREAVLDVIADYELKGNKTTSDVQRRVRLHLLPVFGERRLVAISTADLRAYAVQRKGAGAASATVRLELSIVKRMFKLAMQAGKISGMPHVPMPHAANAREGFFEAAQVQSVVAHLPDELKAVIRVAFVTGWRIRSELLTLQWSQVDLDAGEIRLEPGTTKERGRSSICDDAGAARRPRRAVARSPRPACPGSPRPLGVPPRRPADSGLPQSMEGGDARGGMPGPDPARLPPHRRSQSRSCWGARAGGHENDRAQDPLDLRPLPHRFLRRPPGRGTQAGARH
jgi:integrase